MTVRDLLKLDVDIDVYDDVCEELAVCMCGPVRLTEAGEKHFEAVLGFEVTFERSGPGAVAVVHVDGPYGIWRKRLKAAKELFEGAAGYCSEDEYKKWFEGENGHE